MRPILFKDLDDTALLRQVAAEHDVVINCAISYNVSAATAFIDGLRDRRDASQTGTKPFFIHTSGTSSIAVGAAGNDNLPPPYRDDGGTIHDILQRLESASPYPQRTTDLSVISTGLATCVPTYIIMPSLVYGLGSGLFNLLTVQEPAIIRKTQDLGYTPVLAGSAHGRHNHVHINDLAELYVLLLSKLLKGPDSHQLPSGEEGIYFAEAGQQTWREVSEGVARAARDLGVLGGDEVRELSAEEWAVGGSGSKTLPAVPEIIAHSIGSHGLTEAVLAREVLHWQPEMGELAWRKHFRGELEAVLAQQQQQSYSIDG